MSEKKKQKVEKLLKSTQAELLKLFPINYPQIWGCKLEMSQIIVFGTRKPAGFPSKLNNCDIYFFVQPPVTPYEL